MTKILFITWDGPQTNYMEGLFMPIFKKIAEKIPVEFHVIQFTWANSIKNEEVKKTAVSLGIKYTTFPILKKPLASIGSLITLFTSSKQIARYIKEKGIDIIMPRSTFPSFMVNALENINNSVIFDADGLPIDERVDFAGLGKNSRLYKWLKSIETKMLKNADAVVTRSQKAIDIHVQQIGEEFRNKFTVVYNGRNAQAFQLNAVWRASIRLKLEVDDDELLFVYCGSLGEQYCWEEMMATFEGYQKVGKAKFLVLTGNTEFAFQKLSSEQEKSVFVKSVSFETIPHWLSAADVAFALRKPSYSMQGVAPIKLGEYLLMNLPTIASRGIGDTEAILEHFEGCFLFDHSENSVIQHNKVIEWLKNTHLLKDRGSRNEALKWFSLDAAADRYIQVINQVNK